MLVLFSAQETHRVSLKKHLRRRSLVRGETCRFAQPSGTKAWGGAAVPGEFPFKSLFKLLGGKNCLCCHMK